MHLVHSGPVVTHRSASGAQPAGQQVCANAGDISAYAKTRIASLRYRIAVLPFRSGGRCAFEGRFPPNGPVLGNRKGQGRGRQVLHTHRREDPPPQMVNAEVLKSVPTHQGLPLPRATLPDRAAVPHLSPCAHDPKLTETREIASYV